MQEAASCAISPSLNSALPLRDVTISGFTPSSGLCTPNPQKTQLPRDGLWGAVHAHCLRPDVGPQRPHSRVSHTTTRGSAGPTRVLAAPSQCLCPEVTLPLRTITQTCCYRGGGGGGPADRPAGLRQEDAAASPPRQVVPGLQMPVLTVWFSRPGFHVRALVLGLRCSPVLSPRCGQDSPAASPLTKAATWGPREGLRRPLQVAATHPLQHHCSPSQSPNSSQLLQSVGGHTEHFLGTEIRDRPM